MDPPKSELSWFLETFQDTAYPAEIIKKQRSPDALQDIIRAIRSNADETQIGNDQITEMGRKTKRVVQHFQGISGTSREFEFATGGAMNKLRRKLGNLFFGSNTASKRKSIPGAPHHLTTECSECHGLRANYGKSRVENLTKSMLRGCDVCKLILAILNEYCDDLEPKARVRIFAPFQSGSTLIILCQKEIEEAGRIPFPIEVYVHPGNASPSASIAEASEISGDTSSALALSRARTWLELCKEKHAKCSPKDSAPLPSRLVHISETESGHVIRLAETEGQNGRYACLSHPWGKNPGIVLTTTDENYQKHLKDVPFGSLSPLFKQAIVTAWRLGFHYIWIDSLCIIQQNEKDWDVQASRMEAYYRHADVTLAASKAWGPESGCYSLSTPEFLGRPISWSDKTGTQYTIHTRRSIMHARGWPLSARGWVYQEIMLSPRIIHFGVQELVWECAQGSMCECDQALNFHSDLSGKFEHHELYARSPTPEELRDVWRDTVEDYSNLDLTYHKDVLPALAGLARQMHRVRDSQYLAGLWEDTLITDLLWMTREPDSDFIPSQPRPDKLSAPTWSWACIEPARESEIVGETRISYKEIGSKTNAAGLERCEEHIKTVYATVLSTNCQPLGVDEFGQLAQGEITLKAPVVSGLLQTVPRALPPEEDADEWEKKYYEMHKDEKKSQLKMKDFDTMELYDDFLNDKFLEFYPDYGLYLPGRGHVENNTWVKVVQMVFVNGGPEYSPENIFCLVLRDIGSADGVQKYERIGLAWYKKSRKIDWFAKAEIMKLQIV